MIEHERALRIIEVLTLLHDDSDYERCQKALSAIYIIAHTSNKPDCNKNHPSFVDQTLRIERGLINIGQLSEWTEDEAE